MEKLPVTATIAGPNRIIDFRVGYSDWLKRKGIDWGREYTELGEKEQIRLIEEYNAYCAQAAIAMANGANYG